MVANFTYFIYIKMDLALNNLQWLICHKTQQTKPNQIIMQINLVTIRESPERILKTYSPKYIFTCEQHTDKGLNFAAKIVVNIFYDIQKLASDEVRKHTVKY